MLFAGILVPGWYMQLLGEKKALKTSLLFEWINFAAFLMNRYSGELCIYRVVLFRGWVLPCVCPVFALQSLWEGSGLPGQLRLDPRAVGVRAPPQSSQRGLQPHLRTTVKRQLCKHLFHRLCSGCHYNPCLFVPLAWPHEKLGIPGVHKVCSTGNVCCVPPASGCSKSQGWRGVVDRNYLPWGKSQQAQGTLRGGSSAPYVQLSHPGHHGVTGEST